MFLVFISCVSIVCQRYSIFSALDGLDDLEDHLLGTIVDRTDGRLLVDLDLQAVVHHPGVVNRRKEVVLRGSRRSKHGIVTGQVEEPTHGRRDEGLHILPRDDGLDPVPGEVITPRHDLALELEVLRKVDVAEEVLTDVLRSVAHLERATAHPILDEDQVTSVLPRAHLDPLLERQGDLEDLSLDLLLALEHARGRLDHQLSDLNGEGTAVLGREDHGIVGRNVQLDPGLLTTTSQSRRREKQEHEKAQRELERNPHGKTLLRFTGKCDTDMMPHSFFKKHFLKKDYGILKGG